MTVYNGQLDLICCTPGTEAWMARMDVSSANTRSHRLCPLCSVMETCLVALPKTARTSAPGLFCHQLLYLSSTF